MAEAAAFPAPKLGVGMIFSRSLTRFLRERPKALDFLELEPQTLWFADDPLHGPFHPYAPAMDAFAALPQRKLVHSVGMPLGGTRPPDPAQAELVRKTTQNLDSPWVSEHLSVAGTPHEAAGFLLPPLQTEEGVATAIANIRAFSAAVDRPVAIETGVAYIRRKPFEMRDGAFVAEVARQADCGILLDIHNIYCNERNGRISIDEFLADLPLERVWEVHLAGGSEMDGFYLDAHSGPMDGPLRQRAEEIIRRLPNLGAITFEIYESFFDRISLEVFDDIVDDIRDLWHMAGTRTDQPPRAERQPDRRKAKAHCVSADQWERDLTGAIARPAATGHMFNDDTAAIALYGKLVRSFRGSLLVRALPRSLRYLMLREESAIDGLLSAYFGDVSARLYAPLEAHAFSDWVRRRMNADPILNALLDYDLALVDMARHPAPRIVTFPGNPAPIFEALSTARLPMCPDPPVWELEILPDETHTESLSGSSGGS